MQARGINVHERVRDFAAAHYSANVMKLSVYGRQALDELEAMVRRMFGAVKNRDLSAPSIPGCLLMHRVKMLKVGRRRRRVTGDVYARNHTDIINHRTRWQ